jgi:hypothetical protein
MILECIEVVRVKPQAIFLQYIYSLFFLENAKPFNLPNK